MSRRPLPSLLLVALATACSAPTEVNVGPIGTGPAGRAVLSGNIALSRTLTADTIYTLSGVVTVASGATLTVRPGTRVVGDSATPGSALVVLRGGRLVAVGTANTPIVFTSARSQGNRRPGDWAGIHIIGNASSNRTAGAVTDTAIGSRSWGGGVDDADSSGALRYVRVEFAGLSVGGAAGSDREVPALGLYAVGRRTVLEFVQVLAAADDAFGWFGGTVDGRNLVAYEAGDDLFDWADGYRGRNRFVVGYMSQRIAARDETAGRGPDRSGFEGDGCGGSATGTAGCPGGPSAAAVQTLTRPAFANFTLVGPNTTNSGEGADDGLTHGVGIRLRRATGGTFVNGIVARWPNRALTVRDQATDTLVVRDSLSVRALFFAGNASNYDAVTPTSGGRSDSARFAARGNVSSELSATSLFVQLEPPSLDFTPQAGTQAGAQARTSGLATFTPPVATRLSSPPWFGGAITGTSHVGAVDPTALNWTSGWTTYFRS